MEVYPEHGDPEFADKLLKMKEYQIYKETGISEFNNKDDFEKKVLELSSTFSKAKYQMLFSHYLSRRSPYKSILLYHGLGTGKTCSAITIAESLLLDHTANEPPRILVICSSALQKSFEDQIFSMTKFIAGKSLLEQCCGDLYKKLIHGTKDNQQFRKKLTKLIRSRYQFLTIGGVGSYLESVPNGVVKDKVIIVDEAHNLRQHDNEKIAVEAFEKLVAQGINNRLVLLSATPMYDNVDEIFDLLNLLLSNDKRELLPKNTSLYKKTGDKNKKTFEILKQLASEYISYVRAANPFTFPVKLTPKQAGYKSSITVPKVKNLDEFFVATKKTDVQIESKSNFGSITNFQTLNIVYPNNTSGDKGFDTILSKVDEIEPLQFKYNNKYKDYLASPQLLTVAPKLAKIIDLIKNSTGIVIVYSQFITGGILPLAVALEHIGFSRYSARNLTRGITIEDSEILKKKYKYDIICGNRAFMGQGKIEDQIADLLTTVNSDSNINGNKLKVILMTPIGGEGLNFKNVREVHIMDPWFHINKIDQVIGRALRTFSHATLPLEERNVTVYIHMVVDDKNDTSDVHAYKIAGYKLNQSDEVEKVIRDYALDCSLVKTLNYYPKKMFNFKINMKTSQGKELIYQYGDNEDLEPQCVHKLKGKPNNDTFREEMYWQLLKNIELQIYKYIKRSGQIVFPLTDLIERFVVDKDILYTAIYNLSQYPDLAFHNNSLIVKNKNYEQIDTTEILLKKEARKEIEKEEIIEDSGDCTVSKIKPPIETETYVVQVYKGIHSACWSKIAKELIEGTEPRLAEFLAKEGALVMRSEIPRIKSTGKYIGYIDIFNTDQFVATIINPDGTYRNATDAELREIKSSRTEIKFPTKQLYGIMFPTGVTKNPSKPLTNQLKIFGVGTNLRGAMCLPKKTQELQQILEELTGRIEDGTRDKLCNSITTQLFKQNRLYLYPMWKPKVSI